MDKLILREMTIDDKDSVLEYLKEFTEYGSAMHGLGGASSATSFEDLLEKFEQGKHFEYSGYEGDLTPCASYLVVRESDDRIVGSINFRWHLTRKLDENFGGNIGYGIRPSERRKGYATESLRLGLELCRKKGLKSVRIGCYTDNTGSRKTILNNGGKLIDHKDMLIASDYYEITL